jgi:putative endonuclease
MCSAKSRYNVRSEGNAESKGNAQPEGNAQSKSNARPKDNAKSLRGTAAEREAENYLLSRGLTLLQRNYRCKAGEIDLVMRDEQVCVFVEVRYRKHTKFGSPAETVDYFKQQKLRRTAQYFLQSQRLLDKVPCRFDVVSVTHPGNTNGGEAMQLTIDWIDNAF